MQYLHPESTEQAFLWQQELANKVSLTPLKKDIKTIVACDCAYYDDNQKIIAVVAAFAYPKLQVIKQHIVCLPVTFPYVTGLLAFREAPALVEAITELDIPIDLLMVDGAGIAHPRGLGVASHLGVLLNLPSIGVAKTRLLGTQEMPDFEKGSTLPIEYEGKHLGYVLRSRDDVKPLYISPGHLCSLEDCYQWVMNTIKEYRQPEPIRHVDQVSKGEGRKICEERL